MSARALRHSAPPRRFVVDVNGGNETNAREVSRTVQSEVARAVEDMVGMQVKRIDIHIEDIDFGEAAG